MRTTPILGFQLKPGGYKETKFQKAFETIKQWEGGYVNDPADYGGETYCGITRRYNPDWYGWHYIEAHKDTCDIVWNENLGPLVDHYVLDYYLDRWLDGKFEEITDTAVATYLFDFSNTGEVHVVINKLVLNDLGYTFELDYDINESYIAAINSVPSELYLAILKSRRAAYYDLVASRWPFQRKFLQGWKNRAYQI